MSKGWYILSTFSGYELRVERTICSLLNSRDLSNEVVLDVKILPESRGYVFIELDLPDFNWKNTCEKICAIQGVIGFVGYNKNERPRPISADETKVFLQKIKGENPTRVKQSFSVGDQVKVIKGSFTSFTGTVEDVNLEKSKLRVTVSIFDRATPVELNFSEVELISSKKITIKIKPNSSKSINSGDSGNCDDVVETKNVLTNTINSNGYLIKSVRIVSGRTLNPRWKTDMQVIETDKGTFIDNVPSAQFGYFRVANPGYNWQSLVGKRVSSVRIFVSCGRKWINKQ